MLLACWDCVKMWREEPNCVSQIAEPFLQCGALCMHGFFGEMAFVSLRYLSTDYITAIQVSVIVVHRLQAVKYSLFPILFLLFNLPFQQFLLTPIYFSLFLWVFRSAFCREPAFFTHRGLRTCRIFRRAIIGYAI